MRLSCGKPYAPASSLVTVQRLTGLKKTDGVD